MRFRSMIFAFAAVWLGSSAGAQAQAPATWSGVKFAAEVPLLDCDGVPCVEARIGSGPTLKMGIDTGNVDSVLESSLAKGVDLKPVGSLPAGAPEGMFRTAIPAIRVGDATLENVPTLAIELGDMIAQNQMPRVDGTLAYTAFHDRVLQLDFAGHKLRISEPLSAAAKCEGACDKISLIKFGKEGPPIVVAEGFAVNGQAVSAQVDTMYTGTMLIYTASIEKLQLADAVKTTKSRNFPLTDGGVQMKEAVVQKEMFRHVALGPSVPLVYFPTPDVHEPDGMFDATVGLELFYGAVVTLDFHDMTIGIRKS
jgi:hypothetical protein